VAAVAVGIETLKCRSGHELADKPLVPGNPTLAMVKTMNTSA